MLAHDYSYYQNFSAEQYAADEYFQAWVLHPDEHSNNFWDSYLNLYPAERHELLAARELVQDIASTDASSLPLTGIEKQEIRDQIFSRLALDELAPTPARTILRLPWIAAAAIIGLVSVSALLLMRDQDPVAERYIVERSRPLETREIILPDSSRVILNASSSIRYLPSFGKTSSRDIILEGNAFFSVRKKQDHQPFVVHSNKINITVLGTEFNVNGRTSSTRVELVQGKVRVDANDLQQSAFLKPGDQVEVDTLGNRLVTSAFDTRLYSAWTKKEWNFNQTELQEVLRLIASYYGVTPEFKRDSSRKLRITASIPVADLDMLTLILSKTVHVKIHRLNDRLIIQ